MPFFARAVFAFVNLLATRRGLQAEESPDASEQARARRRTGIRGETFAYWYLRRQGYRVVRRNYRAPHGHGEIDVIAWDGNVLAFVEVKTRTTAVGGPPERAVDAAKQRHLLQTARAYRARRRLADVPCRFDVLALEARPHAAPSVRLHKGAFTERN
ncbi:MAG: YraN family protein [Terriglobia bacterium]